MDPQSGQAITHQLSLAELCEVAGDVGLRGADRMGEFTDAELLVLEQQHQAAQPRGMGDSGKNGLGRYIHEAEYM